MIVRVICDELMRRGIDADPLLRKNELPIGPWSPFARFPRHDVLAFADDCLEASGDLALHVRAMAHAELGAFLHADAIAMMAPSVGFGIRSAMETYGIFNSGCAWTLLERSEPVITTLYPVYERIPHHVDVECTFMAFADRVRAITYRVHGPERLELVLADRGAGKALADECRCEVTYGAPANRFILSRAAWEARPRFAQPVVAGLVRTGAELLAVLPSDFLSGLRRAVAEGLRLGRFKVDDVAGRLGLSARSLQRRLQDEGSSFAAALDDERRRLALELIEHPDTSAATIADHLGYSEPSAFTRAFRRWTGRSLRAWRSGRHDREGGSGD